jgi:hypothetical protein
VDGIHYLTSGAGSMTRPPAALPETLFVAETLGFLSAQLTVEAMEIAFIGTGGQALHRARILPRG